MQGQISAGGLIVGGMIGQRGAPGNGIVSITLTGTSGLEDTYTILYTNGDTETFVVTNGAEGNGIASITKTSSVGLVDTYTILYTNGSSDTIEVHNGEKGDKGDTGATGATPNLTIGSVTKGADASATITGTTDNPVLNLVLPKGDKGDKGDTGNTGATGNGIYSVTKTGTADLVDTYTILYTNGETTTFTITNGAKGDTGATGNGISTITKTGTAGLVDTYTITFTDGTTTTFDVTNGADGNVTDVQVEGTSVVDNHVANITGLATQAELDYYKTIYNVLPKVTGNGESITLNNTGESILKLDTRGQCKQNSTNGTNKFNDALLSQASGYNTYSNGKWTCPVSPNDMYNRSILYNAVGYDYDRDASKILVVKPNTAYTLKLYDATMVASSLGYYTSNGTYINAEAFTNDLFTFTTPNDCERIDIRRSNSNQQLVFSKIMLVEGTYTSETMPSYEEYTGGIPSPNPDFPQQIHEVSGDNEINVEGKNLFDENYYNNDSLYSTDIYKYTLTKIKGNRTLYVKGFLKEGKTKISGLYVNFSSTTNPNTSGSTNKWFINNGDAITGSVNFSGKEDLYFTFYPSSTNIDDIFDTYNFMVSTNDIDYEEYKGASYSINLPVENLLNADTPSITIPTNNTLTKAIGTINLTSGTTYYISYTQDKTLTSDTRNTPVLEYNGNRTYQFSTENANLSLGRKVWQYTATDTGSYTLEYWCHTPSQEVIISDFMISTSPSKTYWEYGTTPIKMRGIGTYEDYFTKNTGKNLVYSQLEGKNIDNTGQIINQTGFNLNIARVVLGQTYTTSKISDLSNWDFVCAFYESEPSLGSQSYNSSRVIQSKNSTFIAPITGYVAFRSDSGISNIQLEKGNSSSAYEPYGTGQWCKYNAIEEVIYNGNQTLLYNLQVDTNTTRVRYTLSRNSINQSYNDLCNLLIGKGVWSVDEEGIYTNGEDIVFRIKKATIGTTKEEVYSYLSLNNLICCYPLATPYLSLIEDETLISQLDKVEKALAKSGQTNISQTNNDAPFKIYATALKEISGE